MKICCIFYFIFCGDLLICVISLIDVAQTTPAYSVQTSYTDVLLPHSHPHFMTVSSHPIRYC